MLPSQRIATIAAVVKVTVDHLTDKGSALVQGHPSSTSGCGSSDRA